MFNNWLNIENFDARKIKNQNIMRQLITFTFFLSCLMGNYVLASKELKVEAVIKDISCFGMQNGEIQLLVTGGKGPYTVEWKDGAKELVRSSLTKGNYSFRVADSKGAFVESEVVVNSPAPISVYFSQNSKCIVSEFGQINIAIDGGTPLSSNWDDRYKINLTETLDVNRENYFKKLKIEDGNGCSLTFPVKVTYIDSGQSFSKSSTPSAKPMAEIQIKRESNDPWLLGGL